MVTDDDSRRRFLRRGGALVVAGIAGCLSDSSGETDTPPGEESTTAPGSGSRTPATTPPTGTTGTSGDCPSDAGTATSTPIPEEELIMEKNDLGVGGTRVALDGNVVLAGNPRVDTTDGVRAGEVAVEYLATGRSETIAPDTDGNRIEHEFGAAVALHRGRAFVTAPGYTNADDERVGAVYVFERSNGGWTRQAQVTIDSPPRPESGGEDTPTDVVGRSNVPDGEAVALHGDTALVPVQGRDRRVVYAR